jgi:hypothetical protein
MNRRGFLSSMLQAGAACMALPAAVTYARTWKRSKELFLPEPASVLVGVDLTVQQGDMRWSESSWIVQVFDGKKWVTLATHYSRCGPEVEPSPTEKWYTMRIPRYKYVPPTQFIQEIATF